MSVSSKKKIQCAWCHTDISVYGIKKHEKYCFLNPWNVRLCVVCGKPIKNLKWSSGTCSHSCANIHYRSGENNGNWKGGIAYKNRALRVHGNICVVCGESRVVDIHHIDGNRDNNEIGNLVPLCPTHHRYAHSKYKNLIECDIEKFVSGSRKAGNPPVLGTGDR